MFWVIIRDLHEFQRFWAEWNEKFEWVGAGTWPLSSSTGHSWMKSKYISHRTHISACCHLISLLKACIHSSWKCPTVVCVSYCDLETVYSLQCDMFSGFCVQPAQWGFWAGLDKNGLAWQCCRVLFFKYLTKLFFCAGWMFTLWGSFWMSATTGNSHGSSLITSFRWLEASISLPNTLPDINFGCTAVLWPVVGEMDQVASFARTFLPNQQKVNSPIGSLSKQRYPWTSSPYLLKLRPSKEWSQCQSRS